MSPPPAELVRPYGNAAPWALARRRRLYAWAMHMARVLVQLLEAKRFADRGGEAYDRLALLLLDNLVETLMYREVESHLQSDRLYRRLLHRMEEIAAVNPAAAGRCDELRAKVLSSTRRRKIDKFFGAKAAYLVELEVLEPAIARALVKLHQYRNEAYHEDWVRAESVQTAVDIYFYLACQVMKVCQPRILAFDDRLPDEVTAHLSGGDEHRVWFDTPSRFADVMLAERELDHEEVNVSLQDHLLLRVAGIRDTLEAWSSSDQRPADLLHLSQVPPDAIRTVEDLLTITSIPVEHDLSSLDRWADRARTITPQMKVLEAFGRFADIEDELEPLERKVMEMAAAMDAAVDAEIDRIRGK